jgi:hypothetical protein
LQTLWTPTCNIKAWATPVYFISFIILESMYDLLQGNTLSKVFINLFESSYFHYISYFIILNSILYLLYVHFTSMFFFILTLPHSPIPSHTPMPRPLLINTTLLACHSHWLFTILITNIHIIHPIFLHSYYSWSVQAPRWRHNNLSKFQALLIWGYGIKSQKN